MMRSTSILLLAGLLAWSAPALAQVTAVSGMTSNAFNAASCDSDELMQATFTYSSTPSLTAQYSIFANNLVAGQELTLCNNQPSSGNTLVDNASLPISMVVSLPTDHEITVGDFLAGVCNSSDFRGTRYLCMRVTDGYTSYGTGAGIAFSVDTEIPGAATEMVWRSGDGAVTLVEVEAPAGTAVDEVLTYLIELRPCDGGDAADAGLVADAASEDGGSPADAAVADAASADAGTTTASKCGATARFAQVASSTQLPLSARNLQNGKSYEVRVKVRDHAGNQGPASAAIVLVPAPEFGFWDIYQGEEQGFGCTSCRQAGDAGGAGVGLLLLLGLALWRRGRARRVVPLVGLVVGLVLLQAAPARAELFDLGVHLGGGPYQPAMDSELGANSVYSCVFEDKLWVLGMSGVDVVLFDLFGRLSLEGELGYFTVGGHERTTMNADGSCGRSSGSTNTLHMLPLAANLYYRFDWPYRTFGFPLAPYGRVGVNATPWAITRNGLLEGTGGSLAGLRTGWQWAAGLALVLDVFDEAGMRSVRESGLFQHAYLWGEWRQLSIDSFGEPGFVLGNNTWMAGLSLDF